ncbi:alanine--tRNA ligase [Candidatus Omnitrophota bacterium]
MRTDELREKFLTFFESKGHKTYPSDTLVPKDDPTLLFTSAGMNQFKQEFLGKATKFRRRASCQRCLRTGDLDRVGKTAYHHTFFEMLGNFSFGDYFKQEAIAWAWEFVTTELKLPQERLWVSVYLEDQEADQIWQDSIGLPADKIVKLGAKDNFWPANAPEEGPNGPCGPCSEIFYDQGQLVGCRESSCSVACDCGRFVEIWNLVFTQFDRQGKDKLVPLPQKNIDTGMGLERTAAVLQGVQTNFEIDIFKPIVEEIVNLAARSPNIQTCYTIADHIRAVTFAIADGVLPSNDDRGYVIRKLIRRAVWHGRALDIKKPFLNKIVPIVARIMQPANPELVKKREEIAQVVKAEEERFHQTLNRAQELAKDIIAGLKEQGKDELPGEQVFRLYDTYGLPLETLEDICEKHGFKLDQQGFKRELELQRDSSRKMSGLDEAVFVGNLASKHKLKATKFIEDKSHSCSAAVLALFREDQPVQQAQAGEEIKIVLDQTCFYGAAGGQIGDLGLIRNKNVQIEIVDAHQVEQTVVHLGKIKQGSIKVGDRIEAEIAGSRRQSIASNHTATHLLQAALRKVLGEHVRQSGSWVGADRLRFDFSHFQALSDRELVRVEQLVNDWVKQKGELEILQMDFAQAKQAGALAFFAEKYQEKVRVVKIKDISLELCGGTHVNSLAEIKRFKIVSESSVASGIRRIEAVTGDQVEQLLGQQKQQLDQFGRVFGAQTDQLPEQIEQLLLKIKELERRLERSRIENFKSRIEQIVSGAQRLNGVELITQKVQSADMKLLRSMTDLLKQKSKNSLIVLGSVWEEKPILVCAVDNNLRSLGLDAAKIIKQIAKDVEGTGGGRADFAQAGGRKVSGLDQALAKVKQIVQEELKQ